MLKFAQKLATNDNEAKPCDKCAKPMASSGPYHVWCAECRIDVHSPIPAQDAQDYCRFFNDPIINGACVASADIPHTCHRLKGGSE